MEQPAFGPEGDGAEFFRSGEMGDQPCGGALRGGVQTGVTTDGIKADLGITIYRVHCGQEFALCVTFQLTGHLLRIILRQCSHLKVKGTVGGHDIQRPATLDKTRLHRGKRGIKTPIMMLRRGQPLAD